MTDNISKEECKNCISYIPHYIKRKGKFYYISGHCANRKPSGHSRKTIAICECFVKRDLQKETETKRKSAVEWFSRIETHLAELKEFLRNDEI